MWLGEPRWGLRSARWCTFYWERQTTYRERQTTRAASATRLTFLDPRYRSFGSAACQEIVLHASITPLKFVEDTDHRGGRRLAPATTLVSFFFGGRQIDPVR